MGRLVVMDSGFPTIKLLEDAKHLWGTRMIATQRGNTAHLPTNHADYVKNTKAFARGFSRSLHSENGITLTYWNDNNSVVFLDNDIESEDEAPITVNQGENQIAIHIPKIYHITPLNFAVLESKAECLTH